MSAVERDYPLLVHDASALDGLGARSRTCPLILQALEALNAAGVPYCYWKDRAKADRVLAGESDLDLLAPRHARSAFYSVMQACGFKAWADAPALAQREFVSFLGFDERAGVIVHVHAHFRLVLGDALAKAFHVPIEEDLIRRSETLPKSPLRVLNPLDEALLRRLRRALEGGLLDIVAWRRRGGGRAVEQVVDAQALDARARAQLPGRVATLLAQPVPERVLSRFALRFALKRELRPWRLYGPLVAAALLVTRTLFLVLAAANDRLFGLPLFARRSAPGGGALIAFVGVDGSGKSTQLARTREWLGAEIDVTTCYFGTGDGAASMLFRPLKAIAEAVGKRMKVKPKGASHGRVSNKPPGPLYSAMFAIWALAVAFDKRVKFAAARRAVARGFIVITDRYPQNEIPEYNDGPLLHRLPHAPEWLRRLERATYERAQRSPPDLVIKLHASAATVALREPDMRPELVAQRIQWLKQLSCGGAKVYSIDASLPLPEVTRLVRGAVWGLL